MAEYYPTSSKNSKPLVIWYDPTAFDESNEGARKSFETTFDGHWFIQNDDKTIEQMFRRDWINKKLIFITSGSVGQTLVPKIHSNANLIAIYIFCSNKKIHETWTKDWSKVRMDSFMMINHFMLELFR